MLHGLYKDGMCFSLNDSRANENKKRKLGVFKYFDEKI